MVSLLSMSEQHIGRRTFLALMAAMVVAFFFGEKVTRLTGLARLTRRLEPGVNADGFNIYKIAPSPTFDEETWHLDLDGLVRRPWRLSFAELTGLPFVEEIRDFQCVEGWAVEDVLWTGVPVAAFVKHVQLKPEATHLVFYSGDGRYTDSLTIEESREPDILLAYMLNGKLLSDAQGLPLRLVAPGRYGYKYVKWVVRVEAISAPDGYLGFWERGGLPADALIR